MNYENFINYKEYKKYLLIKEFCFKHDKAINDGLLVLDENNTICSEYNKFELDEKIFTNPREGYDNSIGKTQHGGREPLFYVEKDKNNKIYFININGNKVNINNILNYFNLYRFIKIESNKTWREL